MQLYPHQVKELEETKELNKVAFYWDMGLGKTFGGSEKMMQLGAKINLVICQKSKLVDWIEHFKTYYDKRVFDLTKPKQLSEFYGLTQGERFAVVGIINYELAFRRKELLNLKNFTLMLDESSMIQNEMAKRSKFIMKLQPANIILLSGTPTSGKYENLWSQLHLLGWNISKDLYWKQYVDVEYLDNQGFPIKIVKGYKNVERLKQKMRDYGCRFLKSEEVFDLPKQIFNDVKIDVTPIYKAFKKEKYVVIGGKVELVGDTVLKKMLYERQLCGQYNPKKLEALEDLIESTNDRLIIFYNFNEELYAIEDICYKHDKPVSIVNGQEKDLKLYEECDNCIIIIQYQAGSMGLNLQKANKIIYFTPPLSSELFEQSKKRIHRIGQESSCFYYMLTCKGSIEEKIYKTLEMRKDYTEVLFEMECSE